MGRLKNIIKKFTEKEKAIFQHIKGEVKRGVEGVKNGIHQAEILPFIPLMKGMIRAKGVQPASGTDAVALQFKRVVMDKSNYENVEEAGGRGGDDTKQAATDVLKSASPEIIKAIIAFIKNVVAKIKAKKDKGGKLSSEEENVLNGAERVAAAAEEAGISTGGGIAELATPKNALIVLAVLAVVFIIVKKAS